jgi:hypothetical protein
LFTQVDGKNRFTSKEKRFFAAAFFIACVHASFNLEQAQNELLASSACIVYFWRLKEKRSTALNVITVVI